MQQLRPTTCRVKRISYSSVDLEALNITEFNTTIPRGLPAQSHTIFRNNSFSRQLTFYVRFCLLTRFEFYFEDPITIFSIKYSYLQNNCTLSLQLRRNLKFVEICERNESRLQNESNELFSNLEQRLNSGSNSSKLFQYIR